MHEVLSKIHIHCTGIPATHNFDERSLISDWSHKHVAFIAGLGRFGLHRMLITEKGCCGRIGSFVIDALVEKTPRPKDEYCLYFYNRSCRACVTRCVNGSLKEDVLDRHLCYKQCLINVEAHKEMGLTDVCGKCACGVPCSVKNPVDVKGS